MSIRFDCSCGQPLTAREEYAGKRVKCTACGSIQTVPAGNPAPAAVAAPRASAEPPRAAPAAAPADLIRFSCSCGQTCQAQAEYAGKRTKCPACQAILTIPGPTLPTARVVSAAGAARPGAIRPASSGTQSGDFEADFDSGNDYHDERDDREERRPRHRKKKGVSWALIGATAAVLLLLGAGGFFLVRALFGGISDDFDLVPRDAQGFVTIRIADVLDTAPGKKLLQQVEGQPGNPLKMMEEKTGLKPANIERITVVMMDEKQNLGWGIVHTNKDYDKDKIRAALEGAEEKKHQDKTYYEAGNTAVWFHSDRVIVGGTPDGVRKCMELPDSPESGPLDDALEVASKSKFHVVAGGIVPAGARPAAPIPIPGAETLGDVKSGYLALGIDDDIDIEVGGTFKDADSAKKAQQAAEDGIEKLKAMVPTLEVMAAKQPGMAGISDKLKKLLEDIDVGRSGATVTIALTVEEDLVNKGLDALKPAIGNFKFGLGAVAGNQELQNNMKLLMLAMHNYHDATGTMPPAVFGPPNGGPQARALYSWRVALLPFVEQDNLFRQFKRDEPWDSPHNKQFLTQMPKVYWTPGDEAQNRQGLTRIQVVATTVQRGRVERLPGSPFQDQPTPRNQGPRIPASFPDGTSITILIVEGKNFVPWTAPRDIKFSTAVQSQLHNRGGRGYTVGLADGSVRVVKPSITDKTLHNALNPADGIPLGPDW